MEFIPWQTIIENVVDQLKPSNGSFTLLGQHCTYKSSKRVSKLKLKYDGEVYCPAWPNIKGSSCTKSEMGSIKHAAKDLIEKAKNAGYITEEQARVAAQI